MSPSFISPVRRITSAIISVVTAGRMKCIKAICISTAGEPPIASIAPNCPTRPLVPIPAPEGTFVILNRSVESGPRMKLARVGGT